MHAEHLYNSQGEWIAFRVGKFVYDSSGDWIGWLPWDEREVVDVRGEYLGTIFFGDRLFRVLSPTYRGYPGFQTSPGYPGYPGHPGNKGFCPLPPDAEDVNVDELETA